MTERPKLLIFIPAMFGGGAERATANIANGLAERGFDVVLLTLNHPGEFDVLVRKEVGRFKLRAKSLVSSINELRQTIGLLKPDIVIGATYGATITLWASSFGVRKKLRIVGREANTPSLALSRRPAILRLLFSLAIRFCYRSISKVICVSEGVKNDLVENLAIRKEKVEVIYNPTNFSEIIELSKSYKPIDFQPTQRLIVIGAGRFVPAKDFGLFLAACAKALKQRDFDIILLGNGSERKTLENYARTLGIQNRVTFPGFVDNPYPWFRMADLFLLTSKHEGLPNVLIQALLSGCDIVSVNCPSGPSEIKKLCPERVSLATSRDPNEIGELIISRLDNASLCHMSFPEGIADFSHDRALTKYENCLRSLL